MLKRRVILICCICVHPAVWHERDSRELAHSETVPYAVLERLCDICKYFDAFR